MSLFHISIPASIFSTVLETPKVLCWMCWGRSCSRHDLPRRPWPLYAPGEYEGWRGRQGSSCHSHHRWSGLGSERVKCILELYHRIAAYNCRQKSHLPRAGIKPTSPCLQVRCSTNWATRPDSSAKRFVRIHHSELTVLHNVPHGNVCVKTKHNQTKGELPRMYLDNTTKNMVPPTQAMFFLNHNNQ